ncbi:ABC transporter permease [Mucilaginibacter sp. CSA2-8R]|uniref:ABC transporter permease n=1 Tax=Mucilaginibacter sp. CSA2-8R TaxID=3141542 RepID=UPI00315D9C50
MITKLDLKIAVRTFFKDKWYNFLNLTGLALGLAAFVLVMLYVDHEQSYDQWNPNINRIFLVEREIPTGPSPYTPGKLAALIKSQCPEVQETGRTNTALFKLPFFTSKGRFLIKQWVGADYSVATILGIKPRGFHLNLQSTTPTILLSQKTADVLFPGDSLLQNKSVNMMARNGMPMPVAGIAETAPGNTNLVFDCIGFAPDITSGKDQSYANQIYQTYVLVKPHTDIKRLAKKIDRLYKQAALSDTSQVARATVSKPGEIAIYLDPLKNLHLKPHYGSLNSYHLVNGLLILALVVLVVTGINFTNFYLAKANQRAKEVGIKKMNGMVKRQIATQFLLEILVQCIFAMVVALALVALGLPYFNRLLQVNLLFSGINVPIITQVGATMVLLTLLAGLYPAMVIAGFNPADVLRRDQLLKSGKLSWVRNAINVLQFACAIIFVIILFIVNRQVTYMKTQDVGFSARQVIYIDNLGLYNTPAKFKAVRDRVKSLPGVQHVTVASNLPGGFLPATYEFSARQNTAALNIVGVDYDYFETLSIPPQKGRIFSGAFEADSAGIVINQAAVSAMNLKQPIGETIEGCGGRYRVIGVIGNVKSNGFEQNVQPTVYVLNDHCGLSKTQIMINAEANAIPQLLNTLNRDWSNINKLDGDNFNYHFLDELYGQLFVKQEQLQTLLFWFSALAIGIASLGFFASAAYALRLRLKETAIRKIFGAGREQLLLTLSKPFFYLMALANLLAWPLAMLLAHHWLATFAYRVHISWVPFAMATGLSAFIVTITVCLQVLQIINFNPAVKLKE